MSGPYNIPGRRRPIRAVRFSPLKPARKVLYVHGFDLPGHGEESELPKLWTPLREDMHAVYEHVQPDAVIDLSLGSIVVLDRAIHHNITAPLGKVGVSRDRALVDTYLADPLFHQRATWPAISMFFDIVRNVRRNAQSIQSPLLMLPGARHNRFLHA